MSDAVSFGVDGHVGVLTLNRPEGRNSMTVELLDAFEARVREARDSRDLRCLVVTGSGKHFCSGADFRTSAELMTRSGLEGQAGMRESLRHVYRSFLALLEVEVPVVAAVNGHAIGGGLGLALVCDVRVVNESAKIGANFVRLGLHPGMAVTWFLPRLVGPERAAELLYTGRLLTGAEAAEYGLALRALPPESVLDEAMKLAREIAAAAPHAVRLTKQTLRWAGAASPEAVADREAFAQALCAGMDDAREGVAALLGKREPTFRGK